MNQQTGFLINLKELSKLVRELITEKLDHKNINVEVDFMHGKFASTESLAIAIWEQLDAHVKALGAELHCIRLHESENNFVEYYG